MPGMIHERSLENENPDDEHQLDTTDESAASETPAAPDTSTAPLSHEEVPSENNDAPASTSPSSAPDATAPVTPGEPAAPAEQEPAEGSCVVCSVASQVDTFFRDQRAYVKGVLVAVLLNDETIDRVTRHLDLDYHAWYSGVFEREIHKEDDPAQPLATGA